MADENVQKLRKICCEVIKRYSQIIIDVGDDGLILCGSCHGQIDSCNDKDCSYTRTVGQLQKSMLDDNVHNILLSLAGVLEAMERERISVRLDGWKITYSYCLDDNIVNFVFKTIDRVNELFSEDTEQ